MLFSFIGSFFYNLSPTALHVNAILSAPSGDYLLGTDRLGRDLLARLIEGGQVSLLIGILSAFLSTFIGLIVGATAGYFKGRTDKSFVLIVDLFLTFPTFFFTFSTCELCERLCLGIGPYHLHNWMDDNSETRKK